MITNFRKKSNEGILAGLNKWFPEILAFTWRDDGSADVETEAPMSESTADDVMQYVLSHKAWESVKS